MNTSTTGLLKGGITRRHLLAAALPAAALSVAWQGQAAGSSQGNKVNRLGGIFIAHTENGVLIFSHTQIPLDPEGKTAALFLDLAKYSPDTAFFMDLKGADSVSPFVGSIHMTNKDTAEGSIMGYALSSQNGVVPPGIFHFTSPEADWTSAIYLPSLDGDGLPGDLLAPPGPGARLYFNRVPFIPYVPPEG